MAIWKSKNWKASAMMKFRNSIFPIILVCFLSCNKSQLSKDLGCDVKRIQNLETIEDVHKKFSLQLPSHWKTNLYYDNKLSSIFSADTTKQLTETYLVDVTQINSEIKFDTDFLVGYQNQLKNQQLVESSSFETPFLKKESFYSRALGKKAGYPYQVINLFIRLNGESHIHAKAEVYGDSLANERLCKALSLIEKTTIHP